jgi:hypothetical protein
MKNASKSRMAALVAGVSIALSTGIAIAPSANAASAASAAFSSCMDKYITAENYAYKAKQDSAALAILYTGYANCYYALSQRNDISDQTEINAVNNYNHYYSLASQAIAKAGLTYYKEVLKRFSLKGLTV